MRSVHAWVLTTESKVRRTGRYLIALLVLSSGLWTAEGWAQTNLLANTGFNTSLASWSNIGVGNGTLIHDATEDVAGNPASGAAELSLTATGLGAQIGIRQCVAVAAGQTYNYGTRMKFPSGQNTGEVRSFIEVEFFSNLNCGTSQNLGEGEGTLIGTLNYPLSNAVWRGIPGTVPGAAGNAVAPALAQSAFVRLLLERASGSQAAQALFDNAFFGIGVIPVELQGFEIE